MTRFSQGAAQRTENPDESQRLASWYTPGLSDAIGDRLLMFDNSTSASLELLRFKPEFGKVAGFEDALRRRVEELASFTHPAVATVRAVETLGDEDGLALISNHTVGRRLSEIQQDAHGPQFATELVGQLVPVLAALQEQGQGRMAHGLLTPERIIVTPDGRLVLSEHVLASAIDALNLPADKLRDQFGIVIPAGASSLDDPRGDVVQLGYLALSLLVGRRIRSAVTAREIVSLLNHQPLGQGRETPRHLQDWLTRALQMDGRSFESANEAERALTEWPQHERTSRDDLPREVAAPPAALATPIIARPPVVTPPRAPEPEPLDVFPREEPESLPAGSLLGLRPTHTVRPAAPDPLLPPVPLVDAPVPVWTKPVERQKSEPVRFRIEPSVEPDVARVPAQHVQHEVAPATSAGAQRSIAHYLVAGLAFVCLVESFVIAGLLASRTGTPAGAEAREPAQSAAARPPAVQAPAAARPTPPAARSTAQDVKPTAAAAATPVTLTRGWLTIEAPFDLQIYEGATLLGTTKSERLSLLAGPHDLRLVNSALNYETSINVEIPAGVGITTRVAAPNGTLSLNALPWANVSLDGKSLGTTPLMNLSVPVGSHEVIWRHPQLGERRQTAVVTARGPVTLVTDLRK